MYVVYSLIDPADGYTVHYVGMSENVRSRFIKHLQSGAEWIESLAAQGLIPICKRLFIHENEAEARAQERHFIRLYDKQGMPLNNSMFPAETKRGRPRKIRSPQTPVVYEKAIAPVPDEEPFKREAIRLYTEERVRRGDILRRMKVGTQRYPLLKKTLDEYDAAHPESRSTSRPRIDRPAPPTRNLPAEEQ